MKALRGGKSPVGDGYVDKMDYNELAGEPAQSVAIGSVITSLRWEVDEVGGEKHAQNWMNLYYSEEISSGDYLGLYDIAYDSPEGHVVRKDDGSLYYSFFDDAPFEKEVELRGLDPQKKYRMIQYEEGVELGNVSGSEALVSIQSKKGNSQGDPVYYQVIKCVPQ
jgi:alpha-galactosidase